MSHQSSTNTPEETAQSKHVQDQYVALFLQQNKRAQAGILFSTVMVFLMLRYRIHADWALAWLALMLLVSGLRFVFTDRLVKAVRNQIRMITVLLLLNGLCIALPVLAFNRFTDLDRTFITILLIGLATGSAVSTSGYKGMFLWFAAVMLLPLSVAWTLVTPVGDSLWVSRGLGVLIVIYLIFLAGLGRDAYRVFNESCRIRFAEQELNQRLASALETAQQASQAKTRFLAAASHDLRQPLHTIGMLVAAIGLRKLDERSRDIVDILGAVSQSLSGQLDGLLDVSKLDAGIVQPELRVVSLTQLVQSHVASVAFIAAQKGLHIKAHCAEHLQVQTDANLLQRILGNLTGNALKFTTSGGVDVFVKKQGQQAVIEVVDTGVGIEPEQQQLVFQEFYQIGNDERDRTKGLGLGLAIVKRVCDLLKIDLALFSRPGEGSRFTLRMPLVFDAPSMAPPAPHAPQLAMNSLRVLVIDDEADVRAGMKLLLEELGCSVVVADGALQASKLAETGEVDLVISDFRLKDNSSGIDAIHQVQHIQPKAYALLITGDTAPDRLQQAHTANIELLHKPVVVNELIKHLNTAKANHDQGPE
jgi:signal transduction histidine kinase/CheY-like chemotaxis protein